MVSVYDRLFGSYMFFHALTFAVAQGSCFKLLPKDRANVNALK